MSERWLTGFEPAISRSTIGPDQPAEQTPNPYAISILAPSVPFARDLIPSHVFAGKRGILGAKTVENGSADESGNRRSADCRDGSSPSRPRYVSSCRPAENRDSMRFEKLVPQFPTGYQLGWPEKNTARFLCHAKGSIIEGNDGSHKETRAKCEASQCANFRLTQGTGPKVHERLCHEASG